MHTFCKANCLSKSHQPGEICKCAISQIKHWGGTDLRPIGKGSRFVAHESEHVEETIVAGGRQALLQAHCSDPVRRQCCNLLRGAAAQALYKQGR